MGAPVPPPKPADLVRRAGPPATDVALAARAIIFSMPKPTNERQSLERELREELPAQLASYQQELAAGQADKARREWLEWQVRRAQKRLTEVERRPAGS